MSGNRATDLATFYELLRQLADRLRGPYRLEECTSRMRFPARGVYFVFEGGEARSDTGSGPRVVRVGTHALKPNAKSTLLGRLSQHRGAVKTGSGNHRGSIFRLHVGDGIIRRDGLDGKTWGCGSSVKTAAKTLGLATQAILELEQPIEWAVSHHIGMMQVLWVNVDDAPGPASRRGCLERNSIALLSNYRKAILDRASASWLGWHSSRQQIHQSGLWNIRDVDGPYDPAFLQALETAVQGTAEP